MECSYCGLPYGVCNCDESGHPWTADGNEDDYSEDSYP